MREKTTSAMSYQVISPLFIDYATSDEIYAAAIVLPVLGIVLVLLRFYARIVQKAGIGIDDWLMIPALVSCIDPGGHGKESDQRNQIRLRFSAQA